MSLLKFSGILFIPSLGPAGGEDANANEISLSN